MRCDSVTANEPLRVSAPTTSFVLAARNRAMVAAYQAVGCEASGPAPITAMMRRAGRARQAPLLASLGGLATKCAGFCAQRLHDEGSSVSGSSVRAAEDHQAGMDCFMGSAQ